jgi:hypothetical protein
MASVVLSGDTSGSITVSAPAVSGSNTQTLVATTGTLAPIVSGTAVASTSGTSIDFTSIPSWVKRITVMFSGVSTSGSSDVMIQLGTGGSPTTSGYLGTGTNNTTAFNFSTGFKDGNQSSGCIRHGSYIFTLLGSNTWACSAVLGRSDAATINCFGGSVPLAGTLNMVRITTVNGTDTFDAGTINILYE